MVFTILISFLYFTLLILGQLFIFSFSSFFHRFLQYDLIELEDWFYHNRLFFLVLIKLLTLVIIGGIYYWDFFSKHKNILAFVQSLSLLIEKMRATLVRNLTKWPLFLICHFIVLMKFFQLDEMENYFSYWDMSQQAFLCFCYWGMDFVFMKCFFKFDLKFQKYPYYFIFGNIVLFSSTILGSYKSYDQFSSLLVYFQLCLVLFFLFKDYVSLMFMLIFIAIFQENTYPEQILTNMDDLVWRLNPQSFSLPPVSISLIFFLLFLTYQFVFSKKRNFIKKKLSFFKERKS